MTDNELTLTYIDGLMRGREEMREQLEAAQSQAATTKNVHVVPPECDRIVWRGSYYHLSNIPDLAASQAREAQLREAIMRAQLGSCSCVTKTNDPQYHKPHCGFRILSEALALPHDDTALRARLKAEREQIASHFEKGNGAHPMWSGIAHAIRNLGDES